MKKSIFALILSFLVLLTFSGCSSNSDSTSVSEKGSKVSSSSDIDDVSYSSMIPNPEEIFTNGIINITDEDGGTAYIFNVENYTEDEFHHFVEGCKEMGFTDIVYDLDAQFGAYSEDNEYWIQASIDETKNKIYIICQESRKR